MKKDSIVKIPLTLFCFIALFFCGCDESLPPRVGPQNVLVGYYGVNEAAVIFRDSQFVSFGGTFLVNFVNIYPEVLQAEEGVAVDIDVWMKNQPNNGAHVHGGRGNVMKPVIVGNTLTLAPRDTIPLFVGWNHRTSGGTPFWDLVALHEKFTSRGERYFESDPIVFHATGSVRTFKTTPAIKLPEIEFTLVYNIF